MENGTLIETLMNFQLGIQLAGRVSRCNVSVSYGEDPVALWKIPQDSGFCKTKGRPFTRIRV